MIIKDDDQIMLACDDCGNETPVFDGDEFDHMITTAKADGWSITRPEGKWNHCCPDCVESGSALAAAKRKFGIR